MVADLERLVDWIDNYFPDDTYSREDVNSYLNKNVKGWSTGAIPRSEKERILDDWEHFVIHVREEEFGEIPIGALPEIKRERPTVWNRIKAWLGRLFK